MSNEINPYRAAGTYCGLSYIPRKADEQLFKAIQENRRYPYCLAPRQSGKSSLLVNTVNSLNDDFHSIFIDLSIMQPKELEDFDEFLAFLSLKIQSSLAFTSKKSKFIELSELIKVAIKSTKKRIIIFLDEIDALLLSKFKELFFAQVRAIFNERSRDISLARVQFVLAGVAQPTDLISSANMSPFNVGIQIKLENLTKEQVISAARHLNLETESEQIKISHRIFHYTNGSVYLTQLILERLWDIVERFESRIITISQIDRVVEQIVNEANNNIHFLNIYNQLQNNKALLNKFILFKQEKEIDFASLKSLELIGITDGIQPFHNLIYKSVFDSNGVLSLFREEMYETDNREDYETSTDSIKEFPNTNTENEQIKYLRSRKTNFIFLFGRPAAGKTSILASLIHYLSAISPYGTLDRVGNQNGRRLSERIRFALSAGKFPDRTTIGNITEIDCHFVPHPNKRHLKDLWLTFLEMAGEDLKQIGLNDETSLGTFPSNIDVFFKAEGISITFILVVPQDEAQRDDSLMISFLDYLFHNSPDLRKSRILLIISKWDELVKEIGAIDFLRQNMPMTYRKIHSNTNAISVFTVGSIVKTDEQVYIQKYNHEPAERVFKWLYQSLTGEKISTWWERFVEPFSGN